MVHGRHSAATAKHFARRNGGKHGQRPQLKRSPPWECEPARYSEQIVARVHIAAVMGTIAQRPESAGAFRVFRVSTEQPRSDAEQDPAAQLQPLGFPPPPPEKVQKGGT